MRSNGPLANKEVAIGGHGWPWVARSSGVAESGRLVRRMSHRVDPAAIAEEARTVRLDAVLGPPRRSVPVGDSSTPESRTLTPLIMVRIQVPQPGSQVPLRDHVIEPKFVEKVRLLSILSSHHRRIILPSFNQQESSFSPSRKPFFDSISQVPTRGFP